MDLPSSLVKKFVDLTKQNEEKTGHYVYGTAIVNGDDKYVQIDGSDSVTSVSIASDIETGDRVLVYIENHVASVIGNITCPASGRGAIDVSNRLQDFEELVVGDLYTISAEIEYVYTNYVSTGYLEANYLTAEYIVGNYLLADTASLTYANIDDLYALREYVENLEASEITVDYLEANYANITDLNVLREQVQNLDAVYATIEWVEAGYATIEDLNAYYAYIYNLNVDIANIRSLLAGTAGVGNLQAIYLTSDNVVIEDALITNAMIANVSADKLTSGTIYTSLIRIQTAEEDESLYIDNSLIQMSEDDLVRLQAGKDATGEYNFYIWNSEGQIMFDATGATADGIGKEVIVNTHVADDANIAGYKLDIDSVASYLNDNGGLVVNAEHVTIGGGTLDYIIGEIQEEIYGLQGVTSEGMICFTPYYAYSLSPDDPPIDDDLVVPALTDVALTDYSFTDVYENDSIWTEDNPGYQAGLYLWVRYYCEYNDGHFEWSTPVLLTDSYIRSITSDLMTEFEVINGEITAKIWQADIDESLTTSITDLWTIIDAQLGSIILEVEYLSTDVSSLSEEFVTISVSFEGISESVYSLENNVTDLSEQYTVISTTLDTIDEMVYSLEDNLTNLSEQYSSLSFDVSSITADVYGLETSVNQSITDLENKISQIDGVINFKTYFCLWNSAVNEPISAEEVVPALTDVALTDYSFTDVYESDNFWTENRLQAEDGQYLWICFWLEFQDGHTEWRGPYCLTDNYIREQYAELSIGLGSISLEVGGMRDDLENNYATKASLVLQLDSDTGIATLSAQADLIYLNSNQIIIESDDFSLIEGKLYAVDAYLEGTINSNSGNIGGFTIVDSSLYNGKSSYSSNDNGVYLGKDGISLGSGFAVNKNGLGHFGNWIFGTDKIYNDLDVYDKTAVMQAPYDGMTWVFAAGGSSHDKYSDCPFRVSKYGELYAESATFYDVTLTGSNVNVECSRIITSGSLTINGNILVPNRGIALGNGYGVYHYLADGSTFIQLEYLDSDNNFVIGRNSLRIISNSGIYIPDRGIALANTYGVYHYLADGSTFHHFEYVDASDRLNVGNGDYITILRGSNVYLNGTSTAVTSDRQFKDNIEPFDPDRTNNLTDNLTPKIYTVASDPETKHIGFIVDEVEDAMRAAGYDPDEYGLTDYYEDDDGNSMGAIRYDEFIPILLYEIQELRDRVNALESSDGSGLLDPGTQLN